MVKIEAAARLTKAVTATYTGTKSKDLAAYLKTLVPTIVVRKPIGGGGPAARDPSNWSGRIQMADAHALGSKLLADGWHGRKRKYKNRKLGKTVEYVIYTPTNEDDFKFLPSVVLYKPDKGETRGVFITIRHPSHASYRELDFLNKLNRKYL